MDFGVVDLSVSENVSDKLWDHGVEDREAWEVLWGQPVFRRQRTSRRDS